jgi:hypothetical protein
LDLKDQLAQLADLVKIVSREDLALKVKLEVLVSQVDLAEMDNPVLQAGNRHVGPQGPAGSPGFNGAPRKGSAISLAGKELQAKTDYQADQVSQVATFIPFINLKIILFKLQN